ELMLVNTAEDANNIRYRVGRLWETHLYDIPKAIATYHQVLKDDAGHQATTEALEGLITRGEHEAMAAEVLEPIYREAGDWTKLIHVYRLLIQATEAEERKLEIYSEVGRIFEHRLHDSVSAFETFADALAVDAGRDDVLNTLERLASDLEAWEELIGVLDER